MKRLLFAFLTILMVVFLTCACTPTVSPGTDSEVLGGETGTPPSGTPSDPQGGEGSTPEVPVTPDPGETGGDGGDGEEEAVEVRVSKTADEMANSIGKSANGDVVSGKDIQLDSNVSVAFGKGSANTEPALYSGAIRVYQNGGTVTVKAENGSALKTVIITCDGEKYGGGALTVSGGSAPQKNGNILTINANSNATEIKITVSGTTKNDRLYVTEIEVIYVGEGGTPSGGGNGGNGNGGDNSGSGEGGGDEGNDYLYYEFTSSEKSTYNEYVGFVIPFFPNNDYEIESYDEDGYRGVYYSALCESETAFTRYLAMFSSYSDNGTDRDEYGDTWYLYSKGDVYIDVCYYEYNGAYYVDVDAYLDTSSGGSGGDSGGGGSTEPDENVITNNGAGLPHDDGDGIYDIDFTEADKVKDVTDQGYYIDGCPTTGSPAVLVIPVDFSDRTASSLGYSIENIKNVFYQNGENDYFSVYDYYYISSYGQLMLDITVLDSWFRPSNTSTYYANRTTNYDGEDVLIGDQMIMDEALAYLEGIMDLSRFDSDSNGVIDAIVLVTTLEIDADTDFYWAYRYWNIYTDSNDHYYEYDGVSANDYLWAPYLFMHEDMDKDDDYSNTGILNPYTFIHEFGHVLGIDDYYDTAYVGSPLDGYDIMDSMMGDHNAYTKFNLGWITSSRLVVTGTGITVTLEAFGENGDTIILANNWDPDLGVYQEYYVLVYYTESELNSGMGGYFDQSGIVVYHVNASLFRDEYEGEIYYDIYNNNTDPSDQWGTQDNLIELVANGLGYVFEVGDTLGTVYDDFGTALGYTFTVDALGESATITVTQK